MKSARCNTEHKAKLWLIYSDIKISWLAERWCKCFGDRWNNIPNLTSWRGNAIGPEVTTSLLMRTLPNMNSNQALEKRENLRSSAKMGQQGMNRVMTSYDQPASRNNVLERKATPYQAQTKVRLLFMNQSFSRILLVVTTFYWSMQLCSSVGSVSAMLPWLGTRRTENPIPYALHRHNIGKTWVHCRTSNKASTDSGIASTGQLNRQSPNRRYQCEYCGVHQTSDSRSITVREPAYYHGPSKSLTE